ncbi:MAG: hypothetical protein IPO27_08300 [Bacteroidetes bacterium]|nr:hypothetical protein [Bacteroidota bacterium]
MDQIEYIGCGRTDKCACHTILYSFDTNQTIDSFRFIYPFNSIVGYDIAMLGLYPVDDGCHAVLV